MLKGLIKDPLRLYCNVVGEATQGRVSIVANIKKATSVMKQPLKLRVGKLNLNEFSFDCVPYVQQFIKSKY